MPIDPRHLKSAPTKAQLLDTVLIASFFLSGVAALVYQVAWQRVLHGVIGVDMDSITVIVSVFMLGIGCGGMLGGALSDRFPRHRIHLYGAAELSIAAYGACSLALLALLGEFLTHAGAGTGLSALACFAVLSVPTTLMGMTLPLLTMTFNERRASVGVSVGLLYFVNTLGAAAGAWLVPFVLLPRWTVGDVVWFGVAGNLAVAFCTLGGYMLLTHRERTGEADLQAERP